MSFLTSLNIRDGEIFPSKLCQSSTYSMSGLSACSIAIGAGGAGNNPTRGCLDIASSDTLKVYFESTSADGDSVVLLKNEGSTWEFRNSGTADNMLIVKEAESNTVLFCGTTGGTVCIPNILCANSVSAGTGTSLWNDDGSSHLYYDDGTVTVGTTTTNFDSNQLLVHKSTGAGYLGVRGQRAVDTEVAGIRLYGCDDAGNYTQAGEISTCYKSVATGAECSNVLISNTVAGSQSVGLLITPTIVCTPKILCTTSSIVAGSNITSSGNICTSQCLCTSTFLYSCNICNSGCISTCIITASSIICSAGLICTGTGGVAPYFTADASVLATSVQPAYINICSACATAGCVASCISFKHCDSAGNVDTYASIISCVRGSTSTGECGKMHLQVVSAGSLADRLVLFEDSVCVPSGCLFSAGNICAGTQISTTCIVTGGSLTVSGQVYATTCITTPCLMASACICTNGPIRTTTCFVGFCCLTIPVVCSTSQVNSAHINGTTCVSGAIITASAQLTGCVSCSTACSVAPIGCFTSCMYSVGLVASGNICSAIMSAGTCMASAVVCSSGSICAGQCLCAVGQMNSATALVGSQASTFSAPFSLCNSCIHANASVGMTFNVANDATVVKNAGMIEVCKTNNSGTSFSTMMKFYVLNACATCCTMMCIRGDCVLVNSHLLGGSCIQGSCVGGVCMCATAIIGTSIVCATGTSTMNGLCLAGSAGCLTTGNAITSSGSICSATCLCAVGNVCAGGTFYGGGAGVLNITTACICASACMCVGVAPSGANNVTPKCYVDAVAGAVTSVQHVSACLCECNSCTTDASVAITQVTCANAYIVNNPSNIYNSNFSRVQNINYQIACSGCCVYICHGAGFETLAECLFFTVVEWA